MSLKETPQILTLSTMLVGLGIYSNTLQFILLGGGAVIFVIYDYIDSLYSKKFDKIFHNCKIENKDNEVPKVISKKETDIGTKYTLSLPYGITVDDIEKASSAIEQALKGKIILNRKDNYTVTLQIVREDFKDVYLADLHKPPFTETKPLEFVFGVKQTENGEAYVSINYHKCEGHILINGGTGGGKSTLLRVLVAQAVLKNLTLHAFDAKGTELSTFRNYDKLVLSREPEGSLIHLTKLYDLMCTRNRVLYKANCKDVEEYNRSHKKKLEIILVIIDEFAPFRKNKKVKEVLAKLLAMARSAGIYIILSTQRIDSETMGDLKVNLGIRLNLKAETKADSQIAMGNDKAFFLKGKGRLYMKYDGEYDTMVQTFFLDNKPCKVQLKEHLKGSCLDTSIVNDYDLDVYTGLPKLENNELHDVTVSEEIKLENKIKDIERLKQVIAEQAEIANNNKAYESKNNIEVINSFETMRDLSAYFKK